MFISKPVFLCFLELFQILKFSLGYYVIFKDLKGFLSFKVVINLIYTTCSLCKDEWSRFVCKYSGPDESKASLRIGPQHVK